LKRNAAAAPCRPRTKGSGAPSANASASGFRNFENYRIRALLCAGKPNWRVLGSIVVR
jgi:hypothetical protein